MKRFKEWFDRQKARISKSNRLQKSTLAEKVQFPKSMVELDDGQFVELRIAIEDDIADILRIQKLSYNGTTPWGEGALRREITHNKRALYLIVRDEKEAVAFIGTWFVDGESHITNIAVVPVKRRNGIAYLLIKKVIYLAVQQKMDKVSLEVRVSNKRAQKLYLKIGFKKVGIKKGYYAGDHEDALEMRLPLLRM
ncbi:ribosomal-protein-alanine N-acetyltransferase [Carnobacterium iners]|uniref:Ribosomal-protein-alanine N-acetyltransferase n=1 Tax=Carnobacterium iners TaxID=1073423 RepID=A0A1X7MSM8_9LACT|nr:ribosomal protein S18-alanine N-acetyltransferase [Carnobacterium iners]SEL05053.1 ribosomal-protein-alanine N-acetyltransferase [Carnobacterium iners]SMH26953.1 ribosomal-protein-alanine N-acetyltransferase [Carnobacterium iners]